METVYPKIVPLSESAFVVELGNVISTELNDLAIAFSDELDRHPFAGFIESLPAYSSVTVYVDVVSVSKACGTSSTAFAFVRDHLAACLRNLTPSPRINTFDVEIPVDFSAACAFDIEEVADVHNITVDEVIRIFTSRTYRVYMIGFFPGFAYMGDVDERIRMPRRPRPRLKVPKGSVGIAGAQTGVYPLETPGGWQIIGRTDVKFFRPDRDMPSFLKPGDSVRFVSR
jgi:inhibitor of KinA